MHHKQKSLYLRRLIHACIAGSLVLPLTATAQSNDRAEIEEVVVTGSYIRNSRFAQNNPVDSVSQGDILESGAPNMGNYIRDLTYTQNTNTVNNVNASNSGPQSGTGTTFNLRGLGENSTLTLVDGVRSIDNSIGNLLPDIAIDRMEVVLDGGSALYGSDAVAGVVNLMPIKQFDGFRVRAYYQRDEPGTFEEPSIGAMYGTSFRNGDVNWVIAADYQRSTPLMNFERPRTLRSDFGWANSGNPGVWRELEGAEPVIGAPHGGQQVGPNLLDPSCGTFNEVTDLGAPLNNPSGIVMPGDNCFFTYSAQWPLSDGQTDLNVYQNLTWELNDRVQLEATMNYTEREFESRFTGTFQHNDNNRTGMVVPADHPANPFGTEIGPHLWRPFAIAGTLPSHFEESTGARLPTYEDTIQRYKLGARFDLTDTWTGYSYYSLQRSKRIRDLRPVHNSRLQAALIGQGGPSGDQWFNPFGSADPRSPYYVAGVTDNSQELVDWIAPQINNQRTNDQDLDIFEVTATGELFQLPYGAAQMATGYQMRDSTQGIYQNPLALVGEDYNTGIRDSRPTNDRYNSKVHAAFVEFEVPILDTLAAQIAVRHERFTTFGLETTTPKIAMRWEALPSLAIRGSWGESFLAPQAQDVRPFDPNESCGEIFFGSDPLTGGTLNGGATCAAGNPNLVPETSNIWNLGFTWEPLDDLSISLDYQSIEYTDRIRTFNHQDVVGVEFEQMLAAIGSTPEAYDNTPGSATREAANAWIAAGGLGLRVQRDPDTQQVIRVVRQAQNVSSVWVDLFDARVRYSFLTNNFGTFTTTLSSSYYTKYEYEDTAGGVQNALGNQNARTGVVPPVPQVKGSLRLNWFMGNHSASTTGNYSHYVRFDDNVNNVLTGTPPSRTIRAQTIWNAQYSYVLDRFTSDVTLSGGISNLFDQQPQRLPILGGFESRLHTPWGRQFWASVDWTF